MVVWGRSVWLKIEQQTTFEGLRMQRLEVDRLWVWIGRIGSTGARGERDCFKSHLCCIFVQARVPVESFYSSGASVQSNNKWPEARESCTIRGLSMLLLPLPHQPLVLMDVQTLYRQFGTARLWRSSVSFEWATLCLRLLFPAQREIASAFWWKCLLSLGKSTVLWG